MHEPKGDLERLKTALAEQWNIDDTHASISLVKKLQSILRKGDWGVTVAVNSTPSEGLRRIVNIWPGYHDASIYGLAIDLGSTTIAAHLTDLRSGKVIESSGVMNPQIRFGEDLMSRVSYAMMNADGASAMTNEVRKAINKLVLELAESAKIEPEDILEAVFVCNPVMHHLLLGIDPIELGQAPFALATSDALYLDAKDLNLVSLIDDARIYLLPCIAGHVGADAAAVALSEEPNKSKDLTLIVDVGTNAEILLGNKQRVLACSSPTGPAFEGAQISSGQRAAPGAIELSLIHI